MRASFAGIQKSWQRIIASLVRRDAEQEGDGFLTLEPVQNLEFWRCKRQNSTLQAPKEPKIGIFAGY
jgi:hypothetical protein